MKLPSLEEPDEQIPLSPLIDCVFLLLIFFLVAAMVKKENKDIAVNLPTSTSAVKLRPDEDQVVIGVDIHGNIYWEGEPCSRNWLHDNLRQIALENPERRIRIDMDKDASFGYFAEIMDACQFYDLKNVGIRTYDEYYNSQ